MAVAGIHSVTTYVQALRDLLAKAWDVKPNAGIEPTLTPFDLRGAIENIGKQPGSDFLAPNSSHYAAIETACREIFYGLVATTSIDDPAFNEVWNQLDIISILSDAEKCEPGLIFWLVEELLDTQTIDGCRIIFDYLDSRRERITAKHFKQKQLIILRACNGLLRRLSRAEDTVFCGRVFIFMFQSFPLGDRSSVNLRGEYHVENVTTFEDLPVEEPQSHNEDSMEMDTEIENDNTATEEVAPADSATENISKIAFRQIEPSSKSVTFDNESKKEAVEPDMDTLYPIFWSLQANFAMPTRLFDEVNYQEFKSGLRLTMHKFQSIHQDLQARGTLKTVDDSKRGMKRKRGEGDSELSTSFNPKYLTSRDLFELEVSDLAFRRHVLVQALILTDFLLSLTPKAKKKLEDKTNKPVLYPYTLSEADIQWATQMKSDIAAYLQQGPEGKFYYRMVDTVLSRDKNWAHWKAEGCPLIERTSVSAEHFAEAKKGAQKACANKRLKATPLGSLDLNFLSDAGSGDGFRRLAESERYAIPSTDSFKGPIADLDFEIEIAKTDEDKQQIADARASKLWRTLRVASKSRLILLDKIDDGHNLQALFDPQGDENHVPTESNGADAPGEKNKDMKESNGVTPQKENMVTVELETNGIKAPERNDLLPESAHNTIPTETTTETTSEIPRQNVVE